MNDTRIQLIYPEKRRVNADTIMHWAHDCYSNDELDHMPETLDEAIEALEDLGHITIERGR